MSEPEDRLDLELRRLFDDERLDVQPAAGSAAALVAGAQRVRRRRRALVATGGAVTAVVALTGGLFLTGLPGGDDLSPVADRPTSSLNPAPPPPSSAPPGSTSSAPPSSYSTTVRPPSSSSRVNTPPPRPSTTRSISRSASTQAGLVIGPVGYGSLRLGMSEQQVGAQGITLSRRADGGCDTFAFSGGGVPSSGSVTISPSDGVVEIAPAFAARTPEGVGFGSAKSDVLSTYPTAVQSGDGLTASANGATRYEFGIDQTADTVSSVRLASASASC